MGIKDIIDKAKEQGFSKKDIYNILNKKGYPDSEIDPFFTTNKFVSYKKDKSSKTKYNNEFEKLGTLVTNPNDFFSNISEESMGKSLGIYALFCIILIIIGSVLGLSRSIMSISLGIGFSMLTLGFLSIFIIAFVIQILLWMVNGDDKIKGYSQTVKVVTYSLLPAIVTLIIPILGFLGFIYSLVLIVIGLSKIHEITIGKAITALAIPILTILAIITLMFFLLFFGMMGSRIF